MRRFPFGDPEIEKETPHRASPQPGKDKEDEKTLASLSAMSLLEVYTVFLEHKSLNKSFVFVVQTGNIIIITMYPIYLPLEKLLVTF